jgi:hypothetical protein
MSKLSNYLEQKLLDHTYNEVALSVPITTYVALFTTDPTDAHVGIFDAITGGNLLHHTILDSSQVVGDGGIFKFLAGALELRLE